MEETDIKSRDSIVITTPGRQRNIYNVYADFIGQSLLRQYAHMSVSIVIIIYF